MIRIGILGAAGYTGGELIRLLLHHPEAHIVFAHSESSAGRLVTEVHSGLVGETDLTLTNDLPLEDVDLLFLCLSHGKSRTFLEEHTIPERVKIIDLTQDFRAAGAHDFVYGLPELNRRLIVGARHVANPGCFATAIQLALLPALQNRLIAGDIHVSGITGSTGAGVIPSATTHYSWRTDNISIYKPFTHQHTQEVSATIATLCNDYNGRLLFVPHRGCFARGIFISAYAHSNATTQEARHAYDKAYGREPFTHHVGFLPSMKQAVNTNKAVVYVENIDGELLMVCCIDNLLKGAVGQAVENMNLMFHLPETMGLGLKASAF